METTPAEELEAVAAYEADAAELADSASATGQTVWVILAWDLLFSSLEAHGSESNGIGDDHLACRLRGTSWAVGDRGSAAGDGVN